MVFKANLERLMARNPQLGSAPKLEAKSGVGKSTIARWLAKTPESSPTLDSLAGIAKAFGVQPWELLVDDRTSATEIIERLLGRR